MKKRLCIVVLTAAALLGVGSGVTPAKAEAPTTATSINTAAPACLKLYIIKRGVCWYGLY